MAATTSQATYEQLLERLVSCDFAPGARLVNRKLAKDLGVSVIPVREALSRLASEGLVEHIPGAGSFARKLTGREVAKLYSFREQLEVYAVGEAAGNPQPYALARLRQILEEAQALVTKMDGRANGPSAGQVRAWLQLDADFHAELMDAADNPWLDRAAGSVRLMSHVIRCKPQDVPEGSAAKTLREHQAIADAVERGDAAGAKRVMAEHIQYSMAELMRSAGNV